MGIVAQFSRAWVAFQVYLDIKDCTRFDFLPALAANVDHPTIYTHPLTLVMVMRGIAYLHAFRLDLGTLVFDPGLEPFTILLGLTPNAAGWDQPPANPLKDFRTLLKG